MSRVLFSVCLFLLVSCLSPNENSGNEQTVNREKLLQEARNTFSVTLLDVSPQKDVNESIYSARFELQWSKSVCPIRLSLDTATILLTDLQGRQWRSTAGKSSPEIEVSPLTHSVVFTQNIRPVNGTVSSNPSFSKGTIGFSTLLGLDLKPVAFMNLPLVSEQAGRIEHHEDIKLQIIETRRTADRFTLLLDLQYKKCYDAFESHRDWFYHQPMSLFVRTAQGGRQTEPVEIRQIRRNYAEILFEAVFPLDRDIGKSPESATGNFTWRLPSFLVSDSFLLEMKLSPVP